MTNIIFAPPRTGKTSFMSFIANETCFNRDRTRSMNRELKSKIDNGFKLFIPQHTVASNYHMSLRKFGYSVRYNRVINPFRLGFYNKSVKTHFSYPYECYFITEAQKYFNSRMSMYFPDWQSRFFEQQGHQNLDFFLDTQRPLLIDVNIRELSIFTEIRNLKIIKDDNGITKRLIWTIRVIPDNTLFERYISSGKKDTACFTEKKVSCDYSLENIYNHQGCKPLFYDGHFDGKIDYLTSSEFVESVDSFKNFIKVYGEEIPSEFYSSRKKLTTSNKEK